MAVLAYEEKDLEKQTYWNKASEAEKKGIHTPIIIPNVLKDVCHIREGYTYEK